MLPYHEMIAGYEQMSLLFNLLMAAGAGGFGVSEQPRLFGQSLLIGRETYFAAGGHHAVRGVVLENLRLASVLRSLAPASIAAVDATRFTCACFLKAFVRCPTAGAKLSYRVLRNQVGLCFLALLCGSPPSGVPPCSLSYCLLYPVRSYTTAPSSAGLLSADLSAERPFGEVARYDSAGLGSEPPWLARHPPLHRCRCGAPSAGALCARYVAYRSAPLGT